MWTCLQFAPEGVRELSLSTPQLLQREVAILGAGVTGIGVAAMLARWGISSVLIDRREKLGGLWTEQHYPGLRLHSTDYYFRFLDDRLEQADHVALLSRRSSAAQALAYLEDYAARHNLLLLKGCEANLEAGPVLRVEGHLLRFRWTIDCTLGRINAGRPRRLQNAEPLSEAHFQMPKDAPVAIVGGGRAGVDAVVQLSARGFSDLHWVCSRRAAFTPRESQRDPLDYYRSVSTALATALQQNRSMPLDRFVSPHPHWDCTKFAVIGSDELEAARRVAKRYGRVVEVRKTAEDLRVVYADGSEQRVAAVIDATGRETGAYLQRARELSGRGLALDMIDFSRRVAYLSNPAGEAPAGASLLGLLMAAVIRGAIGPRDFNRLQRRAVPQPPEVGCLLGLSEPPPLEYPMFERYILSLLGYSGESIFQLLPERDRRASMNFPDK